MSVSLKPACIEEYAAQEVYVSGPGPGTYKPGVVRKVWRLCEETVCICNDTDEAEHIASLMNQSNRVKDPMASF